MLKITMNFYDDDSILSSKNTSWPRNGWKSRKGRLILKTEALKETMRRRMASDETISSMNDSDDGSNCSPSAGGNKFTAPPSACWVFKESHLIWPKIWSKRWLDFSDGFRPKLTYSHVENGTIKREKPITKKTEVTRKLKCLLEIQWNDGTSRTLWRLRFQAEKERDRWAKRITDAVDATTWLADYDIGDTIGEGFAGTIFRCKHIKTQEEYVLKVIPTLDKHSTKLCRNEVKNHKMMTEAACHPNILRYHDSHRSRDRTYIMLEYCKGGDLTNLVAKEKLLSEDDAAKIFCCLIDAVKAMHCHNLIHLDLKLENILLASDDLTDIRVADFGSSKLLNQRMFSSASSGTIGFSAPEVLQHKTPTPASDVFSCGVLLYCLLCGQMPFKGQDRDILIKNTLAGNYNIANETWYKVSKSAKNLITSMIEVDVEKRITIKDILEHEWFVNHNKGYC